MKTVFVVMSKENDGIPSEEWISKIFDNKYSAENYVAMQEQEDECWEYMYKIKEWEVSE